MIITERISNRKNPGLILAPDFLRTDHANESNISEFRMEYGKLIKYAVTAKRNASAPYSGFAVGAALLSKSGRVFTGSNVESSSFGLSMCAERVALFKALSEGDRDFVAIAIASDATKPCPPCGACRQLLWDYAPNLMVLIASAENSFKQLSLRELLPEPFDAGFLKIEDG